MLQSAYSKKEHDFGAKAEAEQRLSPEHPGKASVWLLQEPDAGGQAWPS